MWTSHTADGTEVAKCDRCGANAHRSLVGTDEPCGGRCARTVRPIIETTHTIDPILKRDHNGTYRLTIKETP